MRIIPTIIAAFILIACNKPVPIKVGQVCDPATYQRQQSALDQVFAVTLKTDLGTALKVQRLSKEISEVCQVADQNRMRIFVTNGAKLDSTRTNWILPKVPASRESLATALKVWELEAAPLVTATPIEVHDLHDSIKSRLLLSGVIINTEGLIDFGIKE